MIYIHILSPGLYVFLEDVGCQKCVAAAQKCVAAAQMCVAAAQMCVADRGKLYVSFAKEPYKRDYILQNRPIILSLLLIVATL